MKDKTPKKGLKPWLKRIGVAGFLFFFLKGLVWLFIIFGFGELVAC
tara:strand:+ start:521 stop:658 length:138 start_codon:yes stop_codon:yes gene_type:complete